MNRKIFKIFALLSVFLLPVLVYAVISFDFKLPFTSGTKQLITRGYSGATHIGKDIYALDFTMNGCDGWNTPVLAVDGGKVILVDANHVQGEKNSYGNQVLIDHKNGFITRYAHLNIISVDKNDEVMKGQQIGTQGNTGSVEGKSCKEHPGTHLHFSMYQKDANGNFTPYKPEPMSGYTDFKAGEWYTSDNELYDPNKKPEQKPQPSSHSSPPQPPPASLWTKILNFFSELFTLDKDEVKTEELSQLTPADTQTQTNIQTQIDADGTQIANSSQSNTIYQLQFLNSDQTLTAKPGEVLKLKVELKNTGTALWEKTNISANVAGGTAANLQYYHSSWLTYLRPVLLNENEVESGGTGSFSFTINTPEKVGDYVFKIQAIRIDDGFAQIPAPQDAGFSSFWSLSLRVEEVAEAKEVKEQRLEEKSHEIVKLIKQQLPAEEIEPKLEEVKEVVRTIFRSGNTAPPPAEPLAVELETEDEDIAEEEVEEEESEAEAEEETEDEDIAEEEEVEEEIEVEEIILPAIQITSPTTSLWITTASSTIITGTYNSSTSDIFACVGASLCTPTSTPELTMVSGTWQYPVQLSVGTSTFTFVGWDEAMTTSSALISMEIVRAEEPVLVDETPPIITSFVLAADETAITANYGASDDSEENLEYHLQFIFSLHDPNFIPATNCQEDNILILPDTDPLLQEDNFFVLYEHLEEQPCTWFTTTTLSTTTVYTFLTHLAGFPIYFRLQAVDKSGNASAWQYADFLIQPNEYTVEGRVMISEIAWMGTSASSTDEWLEICNYDDKLISLVGWKLVWGENIIRLNFEWLDPWSCLLLEKGSQETVSDYDESQIYSADFVLSDEGESLILYSYLGQVMDEVDASGGWFAGDSDTQESMFRRFDEPGDGSDPSRWLNFSEVFSEDNYPYYSYHLRYDADNNLIAGSPGEETVYTSWF